MGEFDRIRYDPARDRLLGADAVGDFHGYAVKKILLSMSRAMTLKDALLALDDAYEKQFGERANGEPAPYPVLLFAMDPGVRFGSEAGLPEEYAEVAQVVTIIPGTNLLESGPPTTREAREQFTRQLFRILRAAHFNAHLVFHQEIATSFNWEYVTSKGEFVDLYYMTVLSDVSGHERRKLLARDFSEALQFLRGIVEKVPIAVSNLFELAVSTYLDMPVLTTEMQRYVRKAVDSMVLGSTADVDASLSRLAETVH